MSKMLFSDQLCAIGVSPEIIEWAGDCGLRVAWAECDNAGWMIEIAEKAGVDRDMISLPKWAVSIASLSGNQNREMAAAFRESLPAEAIAEALSRKTSEVKKKT